MLRRKQWQVGVPHVEFTGGVLAFYRSTPLSIPGPTLPGLPSAVFAPRQTGRVGVLTKSAESSFARRRLYPHYFDLNSMSATKAFHRRPNPQFGRPRPSRSARNPSITFWISSFAFPNSSLINRISIAGLSPPDALRQ